MTMTLWARPWSHSLMGLLRQPKHLKYEMRNVSAKAVSLSGSDDWRAKKKTAHVLY